jgi:ferrous iron transport protein A
MKVKLSQVPLRTPCTVVSLIEGELSTRLMELGIIPETKLEVLFSAPGGCPIAVLVGESYMLGLRKKEADAVTVYLTKPHTP